MKIFIYKTLIVIAFVYLLFQLTIGQIFKSYENKIENIMHNKQDREKILNKIREEIRNANQKENLFTSEDKKLISNFVNKVRKELNINETE